MHFRNGRIGLLHTRSVFLAINSRSVRAKSDAALHFLSISILASRRQASAWLKYEIVLAEIGLADVVEHQQVALAAVDPDIVAMLGHVIGLEVGETFDR